MADQDSKAEKTQGPEARSVQRGRTSPSHTLEESIDGVRKVFRALGTTRHSRDDAASAMGYKPGSGAANSRVGSLTHFGLLDRHGANYQVSALARRIIEFTSEAERDEAIAEAAASPSLYSELLTELDGQPFPPMLSNILSRNYGVVPKLAPAVAARFEETLKTAGLLKDGKVSGSRRQSTSGNDEGGSDAPATASAGSQFGGSSAGNSKHGTERQHLANGYQIPLRRGRTAILDLPRPVESSDLERIKSWIDLMEPVLTENPMDDAEQ